MHNVLAKAPNHDLSYNELSKDPDSELGSSEKYFFH